MCSADRAPALAPATAAVGGCASAGAPRTPQQLGPQHGHPRTRNPRLCFQDQECRPHQAQRSYCRASRCYWLLAVAAAVVPATRLRPTEATRQTW
eukprot:15382296-Alexandrium_andersonii.AAC.1